MLKSESNQVSGKRLSCFVCQNWYNRDGEIEFLDKLPSTDGRRFFQKFEATKWSSRAS